jgi:integrase
MRGRTRVLADAELAALWRASEHVAPRFRAKFRLLALTGARRAEVEGVHPREVNGVWWNVPAARTKGVRGHDRTDHCIPLTDALRTVLADVPGDGFKVDTTNKMHDAIARLAPEVTDWHVHDLRHAVRTWLSKAGCPHHIA